MFTLKVTGKKFNRKAEEVFTLEVFFCLLFTSSPLPVPDFASLRLIRLLGESLSGSML
jgi:hypothetical protein